jgi:hypothetical protein
MPRQLADALDEIASQPSDDAGLGRQASLEFGQDMDPVERARSRFLAGHQLVEMPAQPVLVLGAGGHEVVTMVDQQANVPLGPVQGRHRQVRFAERRAGHGEGIDRIALARFTARASSPGHQLGWDADDSLPGAHQIAFERAREMATVLEREGPLRPLGRPAPDLEVTGGGRTHHLLGQLASGLIHGDEGMTALVQIGSDDDHIRCLLLHLR